jgi:hypothetical protein
MAITITWSTKVINVPKADLTLIQSFPTEIRELDLNGFRLTLKALEASEEGMSYLDSHQHNPPVTVGGVELARVVEIINGYTVTFEDDQYAVNLVGANSNVADVVNVNQVSVRSGNSAGLVTSSAIEYGEYDGGVHLDAISGEPGTIYPIGTPRRPVDNLDDAKLIASVRGFDTIFVEGDYTFDSADTLDNFTVIGQHPAQTSLIIPDAANITNNTFEEAYISGKLDGGNVINFCHIGLLDYIDGAVHDCQLEDRIVLGGSTASLINCWSGVPGSAMPIIDFNNTATYFYVRNYTGGMEIRNVDSSVGEVSIDILSGHIFLDSAVLGGTITVRGIAKLTDSSGGTAIINSEDLLKPVRVNQTLTRNEFLALK